MALNEQKHIFAIWGAPGGGKTTLAVNMAVVLADSGYMTCLVSATDHGELQAFLGTAIPKNKGLYAAISSGRHVREALTEARQNLCILEMDTGGDAYNVANITPEQVTRMINDLRDHFTYVIIDCTNYKESVFTGLGLVEADKVVVCIPHRASAANWHIANAQMLEAIATKTMFVDCNTLEGGCNMEQLLVCIELPECDQKLPRVESAYMCENIAKPIVLNNGKSERKYKEAVLKLIRTLLDIENAERKRAKKKKPGNKGALGPGQQSRPRPRPQPQYDDDDYDDEPQPQRRPRPALEVPQRESDGLRSRNVSKRAQRKAEEEAMRRAQQGYYDDDDDDYDD